MFCVCDIFRTVDGRVHKFCEFSLAVISHVFAKKKRLFEVKSVKITPKKNFFGSHFDCQRVDLGFFFATISFMTVKEKNKKNLETMSYTVKKISSKPRRSRKS